ncbi:MAG: MFS transporter [Neisseriaceae bacterium]
MKTGTDFLVNAKPRENKKYTITIILLCIGYFIDFYDLTIFSASYVSVFRDLFHINDINQIQRLYLNISSIYTAGIFCGAILFGILGDKMGRTAMIRFSILIYSIAMIASVFATSIPLFTFLRFISGVGLATEFATSSVLINELLPTRKASYYSSFLYFCGVLGGITATYLGVVSWKLMYLFGGFAGIAVYILRKKIFESSIFLNLDSNISKGNILQIFTNWQNTLKFIRLLILIVPFNFLIVIMFIYPRFMDIHDDLAILTRELLTGFFIGNLISTIACNFVVTKFKDFRSFLLLNTLVFAIIMPVYAYVNKEFYLLYAVVLGLLGGGLPTIWIQVVVRSYGTNIRSTASNALFATGRLTAILFNSLISGWLLIPQNFKFNVIYTVAIIVILVLIAIFTTKNNYDKNMEYIES